MSTPFFPINNSATIVANDLGASSLEIAAAGSTMPDILYINNNDATFSATINVGFGNIAAAVMPSAADGVGVVVGPQQNVTIRLNSAYQTAALNVSAISDGTARLFISQGVL